MEMDEQTPSSMPPGDPITLNPEDFKMAGDGPALPSAPPWDPVKIDADGFPHIIDAILATLLDPEDEGEPVSRVMHLRLVCSSWRDRVDDHFFDIISFVIKHEYFRSESVEWVVYSKQHRLLRSGSLDIEPSPPDDYEPFQRGRLKRWIRDKFGRLKGKGKASDSSSNHKNGKSNSSSKGENSGVGNSNSDGDNDDTDDSADYDDHVTVPFGRTRVLVVCGFLKWNTLVLPFPIQVDTVLYEFEACRIVRLEQVLSPLYPVSAHSAIYPLRDCHYHCSSTLPLGVKRIVIDFTMGPDRPSTALCRWTKSIPNEGAVDITYIRTGEWTPNMVRQWGILSACYDFATILARTAPATRISLVNVPSTLPGGFPDAHEYIRQGILSGLPGREVSPLGFGMPFADMVRDRLSFLTWEEYAAGLSPAQLEYETMPPLVECPRGTAPY